MQVRFYYDGETGEPHLHKHGITQAEAVEALESSLEDRPGRDGSRIALGRTESGRYIRVVYIPDPDDNSVFVVTACDLKSREKQALARRMRRK